MPANPASPKPAPGALIDAIEDADTLRVQRLIEQGADVNERDVTGNTPLFRAASYGYTDIVRRLLAKKADVDSRNNNGDTPLMGAAASYSNNRDAVVRLLLDNNADTTLRNNKGKTALDIAAERGRTSIANTLRTVGAERSRLAEEFAKASEQKKRETILAQQKALREKSQRTKPGIRPAPPKAA